MDRSATEGSSCPARPRLVRGRALRLLLGTGAVVVFWWLLFTGTASAAATPHEHGDSPVRHSIARTVEHVTHHGVPPTTHHVLPVRRPTRSVLTHVRSHLHTTVHTVRRVATTTRVLHPVTGPVRTTLSAAVHRTVTAGTTHHATATHHRAGAGHRDTSTGPAARTAPATPGGRLVVLGLAPVGAGAVPATPSPSEPSTAPAPSGPTPDLGGGSSAGAAVVTDPAPVLTPTRLDEHPQTSLIRPLERASAPGCSPD